MGTPIIVFDSLIWILKYVGHFYTTLVEFSNIEPLDFTSTICISPTWVELIFSIMYRRGFHIILKFTTL